MPMKHATPRIFAVLRVVDSEISFMDNSDCFGPFDKATCLFDSRDEAYQDARKVQGLVVQIGWRLAEFYGVQNAIWDMQRAAEGDERIVVLDDAAA